MNLIALKLLLGDRAKFLGILLGITFASLLITQQSAIFVGLMTRTYGAVTDLGIADLWVMDPKVQFIDDIKPLQEMQLHRVRGIPGVAWAAPLYRGLLRARLSNGNFQSCWVIGLDDASLAGGPPRMLEGRLEDLRRGDGVIVDAEGANGKLARILPDGSRTPLHVGDTLELNDRRAVVVGICRVSHTFQSQPVIYTTYTRATAFAPAERKRLSFVLVKARPGEDPDALCARIREGTGLAAHTSAGFKELTYRYFMKYTGIPINFGIAVTLGFLVGTAVAGQTFYSFTLENLRHFGTLKAMGATHGTLLRMVLLQALFVGGTGYGIGVGLASLFGSLSSKTELAFHLPWQLPALSAAAVAIICTLASVLSLRKVFALEPAAVFKN